MEPFVVKAKKVKKSDKKKKLKLVIPQKFGGILVNYLEFDADGVGDMHMHPDGFEMVYLLKGRLEFESTILSEKGDMACFPAGVWHKDKFTKGTQLMVIRAGSNKVIK